MEKEPAGLETVEKEKGDLLAHESPAQFSPAPG